MNKRKNSTKRSFVMSLISLFVCVAMLIGTTFAWFTDTVTSGKNQIVAGNLDVELEYVKESAVGSGSNLTTASWSTVQGATDLFEQNTLWEPGHTEVVYLKMTNKGTLAVDYKLLVYAAAETAGWSVEESEFKLSEGLKFSLVDMGNNPVAYANRGEARAAATSPFNLGTYPDQKEKVISGFTKYMALIVYMPETVGNSYNYKTGTDVPTVDLAIRLEATQAEYETDSFGIDYDKDADGNPDHPEFGNSPETVVTKTQTVTGGIDGNGVYTATTTNAPSEDSSAITNVVITPKTDNPINEGTTLTVVTTSAEESTGIADKFTVEDGSTVAATIDLTLSGAVSEFDEAIITTHIAKGLAGVTVKFNGNGDQPTFVSYNPNTGELVFKTTHFSEYYVTSTSAFLVSDYAYGTLGEAVASAQNNDTIILLRDAEGGGVSIDTSKKSLIFNLAGNTYKVGAPTVGSTGTETNGFQLLKGGNIVFKNGTLLMSTYSSLKIGIQNYCNLKLDDVILDASSAPQVTYVVSNNNGNTNIIGNTSIIAYDGKQAFDLYYWPEGGYDDVNVTVDTTGTIKGKIEYGSDGSATGMANITNKAKLELHNGNFVNVSLSVYKCNDIPKISKSAAVNINAPDGYTWNESGTLNKIQ